jgi:hypothetical protein
MHPHPSFANHHAHEKEAPKKKREAERREAHPTMAASCDAARASQTSVRSLRHLICSKPARLSALHCGACRNERTLQLSPGRASRE